MKETYKIMLLSLVLQMRQLGHGEIKRFAQKSPGQQIAEVNMNPEFLIIMQTARFQVIYMMSVIQLVVQVPFIFILFLYSYIFMKYISQKLQAHFVGLIHAQAGLEFILEARMGVISREESQSGSVIYAGYRTISMLSVFLSQLLLNLNSIIHWSSKCTYFRIKS